MITVVNAQQATMNRAAGMYDTAEIQYTSTVSLSGREFRFNPGLWLVSYANVNQLPTEGYRITYPFAAGTYNMQLIAFNNNQSQRNMSAQLIVIDNRNFIVRLRFVALADINDFITTQNIPPLLRVLDKKIGSTAVYDVTKELTFWIGVQLTNGIISNRDGFPYAAGHFNLSPGNQPPIAPFTYAILAGQIPVNGFSTLNDNDIAISIPTNLQVQGRWYFGIIQTTNAQGSGNFWQGVNMQYCEINLGVKNTIESIPNNRITNVFGLLNIGSQAWGTVRVAKEYFSNGESYRFFVAAQLGSNWQSWITDEIAVIQNYEATRGDINVTSEIDGINGQYGNCINNVAPGTQLNFCFQHNKTSYNTMLANQGLGVSFDNNLQSVEIIRVSGLAISNGIPTGTPLAFNDFDSPTDRLTCVDIIADQNDLNSNVYIAAIWTFNVQSPQGQFTDTIVSYAKYSVAEAAQADITIVNVLINGEQVDIPAFICDDVLGEIRYIFDLSDLDCEDPQYTVTLHEKDNPSNQFDCISEITPVVNGGFQLWVDVQIDCLPIDIETCLTINLICESESESGCIECFDYIADVIITAVSPGFAAYDFEFDYSNFIGFERATFEIANFQGVRSETSNDAIGRFSFSENFGGPLNNIFLLIYVAVEANGCIYEMCYSYFFTPQEAGQRFSIQESACPGNNGCEDITQFGNSCIEITPTLELICNEPGKVIIDGNANGSFDLFYNFDGSNDWIAYTGEIEINPLTNPTCSVFAKLTIDATEFCPEINAYALIDNCCPETECPEFDCDPSSSFNENTDTLTVSYNCETAPSIDNLTFEYSLDGGITFTVINQSLPASSGSFPIDTNGVDEVLWKLTIRYSVEFPLCPNNEFQFEDVWFRNGSDPGTCDSNPGLDVQYNNGCHTALKTGDVFFIDTDEIYFSLDNGQSFTLWNGVPICGFDFVVWKREVIYTNDCPCACIVAVSTKEPIQTNCECIRWVVTINKAGDLLCPNVFGLTEYTLEWHRGTNNGFVPVFPDQNGCVIANQNGLYRLTITDENGCKRDAYRNVFECEDCPTDCELVINKIDDEDFGTYEAELQGCESEFTGEWLKWAIEANDWISAGTENPFNPTSNGVYRYVATIDDLPECTLEASIELCKESESESQSESESMLGCDYTNKSYKAYLNPSDDQVISITIGELVLDVSRNGEGFSFPYDYSADPNVIENLRRDLQDWFNGRGVQGCCEGEEIDSKVGVYYNYDQDFETYFVYLNIYCIGEIFIPEYQPIEAFGDGEKQFNDVTENETECCGCQNSIYWAFVQDSNTVVNQLIFNESNLLGTSGFAASYNLSDTTERNQLISDFEAWVGLNEYITCCEGINDVTPILSIFRRPSVNDGWMFQITCFDDKFGNFDSLRTDVTIPMNKSPFFENCCTFF
jgi:hypothetical protein